MDGVFVQTAEEVKDYNNFVGEFGEVIEWNNWRFSWINRDSSENKQ